MNIESLLKAYGMNDKEVLVYLSLVRLGPSPVRLIAETSGVNRGTTYDILKSLMNDGLVTYYHKAAKQHFAVQPPDHLLKALQLRQVRLRELSSEIEATLPELNALFEREGGKPQVSLYEGMNGIRQILDDVLETMDKQQEKLYYVYSSSKIREDVLNAMPNFTKKRIKLGISVCTLAIGQGGGLAGLDQRRWLNQDSESIKVTYTLIYGGKVAHISLDDMDSPVGVVISNQAIYQTQKMIFESAWNSASQG